jgi:hypothetical protein
VPVIPFKDIKIATILSFYNKWFLKGLIDLLLC